MNTSILAHLEKAGPYSIATERIESIRKEAAALHYPLLTMAPERPASNKAWLKALGKALAFPEHFGANFDALYDCLCDREVMPQNNCVLLFQHLAALSDEGGRVLLAVSRAASEEWRAEGRRLWILFEAADLDLDPLPLK